MKRKQYFSTLILYSIALAQLVAQLGISATDFQTILSAEEYGKSELFHIYEDHFDFIWLCRKSGLFRYDGYEILDFSDLKRASCPELSHEITHIYQDQNNTYWVGTQQNGLIRYDSELDSFQVISPIWKQSARGWRTIWRILDSDDNTLWLATAGGLVQVEKSTGQSTLYLPEPETPLSSENNIRDIAFSTERQGFWLGTTAGLHYFDLDEMRFTHVSGGLKIPKDRASRAVREKEADEFLYMRVYVHNEEVWMSSWGAGIVVFNPSSGEWRNYKWDATDPLNPLSANVCHDLVFLPSGDILFNTKNEVGVFNTETEAFSFLKPVTGHPNSILSGYGTFMMSDRHGRVWAGFSNGTGHSISAWCNPEDRSPGTLGLTALTINNTTQLPRSEGSTLELDPSQNDISLSFAVINPLAPPEIFYSYRLTGYDSEWIESGTRRTVQYTNLPGGTYAFETKATGKGLNIASTRLLTIKIITPLWRRPWFVLLSILGLLILLSALISWRQKRRQKREAQKSDYERKLIELELAALRAQMNPHFVFNSLNSINQFILTNEPRKASRYLTKFSQLMRQILNNSKSETILLQDEIKALTLYLEMERLRFKEKFVFTIEVDQEISAAHITLPPMVLQPYVENAIWHGLLPKEGQGAIHISFNKMNDHLICKIDDNGIGRERAQQLKEENRTQKKSLGMHITSSRLELFSALHRSEMEVQIIDKKEDGRATGTRIMLKMPLTELRAPVETS